MKYTLILLSFAVSLLSCAQKKNTATTVAFYNLENLFDTKDQENIDEEYLPRSEKNWDEEKYQQKLHNLSKVIAEIGKKETNHAPDIIGVCEVENLGVLEDLITHPNLKKEKLKIVHKDSPDKRGIDVGLLYNPTSFKVLNYTTLTVIPEGKTSYYTRDILCVSGKLNGTDVHVFVNHWPSRRGGEKETEPLRMAASKVCQIAIDSVKNQHPNTAIIVMGDFNDDPFCNSITSLKQQAKLNGNWNELLNKGQGTLTYRGKWNLFDQILLSPNLYNGNASLKFEGNYIFKTAYLVQTEGKYAGHPNRTFGGRTYLGGYSDHFPVYTILNNK